ncbi:DUF4411 family protein [Hyphomonas sp. NPDC076900]|uniref:DUF4411 family protein n=1 Tax=unclassified Hyphomonas TaxID=2630699 RepID=UPI003CFBE93C
MNPLASKYCIDTSALIEWWADSYGPDIFQSIPERMAKLVQEGRLRASRSVKDEIKEGPKDEPLDLARWCRSQPNFYEEDDAAVQKVVKDLLLKYQNPPKKKNKGINGADPFVVGRAHVWGTSWCVVSAERPSNGSLYNPNIPFVCAEIGVEHIDFQTLMRREGWKLL